MTVSRFVETAKSRKFKIDAKGASLNLNFLAYRTDDETEVYAYAYLNTPTVYDGLIRASVSASAEGGGVWVVDVDYSDPSGDAGGGGGGSSGDTAGTPLGETPTVPSTPIAGTDPLNPLNQGLEFELDTSGGTKHITQSIETLLSVKRGGGTAPDFKQAIGVTKDGTIAGCDIHAPKFDFTVKIKRATVTLNYIRTLVNTVGQLNDDTHWGFAARELIYLGCSAQGTQRGEWVFSHKFGAGTTLTDVDICTGLTLATVGPWDYVWVYYVDATDTIGGVIVSVPEAAYCEMVYYSEDFSLLELGT